MFLNRLTFNIYWKQTCAVHIRIRTRTRTARFDKICKLLNRPKLFIRDDLAFIVVCLLNHTVYFYIYAIQRMHEGFFQFCIFFMLVYVYLELFMIVQIKPTGDIQTNLKLKVYNRTKCLHTYRD